MTKNSRLPLEPRVLMVSEKCRDALAARLTGQVAALENKSAIERAIAKHQTVDPFLGSQLIEIPEGFAFTHFEQVCSCIVGMHGNLPFKDSCQGEKAMRDFVRDKVEGELKPIRERLQTAETKLFDCIEHIRSLQNQLPLNGEFTKKDFCVLCWSARDNSKYEQPFLLLYGKFIKLQTRFMEVELTGPIPLGARLKSTTKSETAGWNPGRASAMYFRGWPASQQTFLDWFHGEKHEISRDGEGAAKRLLEELFSPVLEQGYGDYLAKLVGKSLKGSKQS